MASPLAYRTTKVTISGIFGNGAEEWSTGFYMGYDSGDADLPNQQLADDIRAAWAVFMANASINNNYEATLVKVSSVGTDGRSSAEDTQFSTFPTVTKGTSTNYYPPQIALVATLTSSKARGVASKGRMYLPGVGHTIDSTGHIAVAAVNGTRDALKTFLNACNASTATNNVVVLASHGSLNADGTPKIGGSGPETRAVTGIKIGNVYDTQRRRRNGLAEVYSTTTLV